MTHIAYWTINWNVGKGFGSSEQLCHSEENPSHCPRAGVCSLDPSGHMAQLSASESIPHRGFSVAKGFMAHIPLPEIKSHVLTFSPRSCSPWADTRLRAFAKLPMPLVFPKFSPHPSSNALLQPKKNAACDGGLVRFQGGKLPIWRAVGLMFCQRKFGRNFPVTDSREEMSTRSKVKEKRCGLEIWIKEKKCRFEVKSQRCDVREKSERCDRNEVEASRRSDASKSKIVRWHA